MHGVEPGLKERPGLKKTSTKKRLCVRPEVEWIKLLGRKRYTAEVAGRLPI